MALAGFVQAMSSGPVTTTLKETASTDDFLPQFPGEDSLAHEGTQWKENARAALGARDLLAVAQGQMPSTARCIIDVDLATLPELPESHRDASRRLEKRIEVETRNKENAQKRMFITLAAWTKVYAALKACTLKNAPVLSRTLHDRCDLEKTQSLDGGFYDGPLAWKLVLAALNQAQRTEQDKAYYRKAERLQTEHRLADGCPAADYAKKALAFILHINPNLAQPYSAQDVSQYLLDLMPTSLRESGRRMRSELKASARLGRLLAAGCRRDGGSGRGRGRLPAVHRQRSRPC